MELPSDHSLHPAPAAAAVVLLPATISNYQSDTNLIQADRPVIAHGNYTGVLWEHGPNLYVLHASVTSLPDKGTVHQFDVAQTARYSSYQCYRPGHPACSFSQCLQQTAVGCILHALVSARVPLLSHGHNAAAAAANGVAWFCCMTICA